MRHQFIKTRPSTATAVPASDIARHTRSFLSGEQSSLDATDACLERIRDPAGEGKRTFTKVWADEARAAATAQDTLMRAGYASSPITGIPISIKDMLDVKGETTRAGAKALDDAAPATEDSPVVRRLKAAGAVLVGRTNMAQFAFSIVGLNPHFGTPGNPWNRSRIPGGSSSGAAVSVADGMAVAAIGSDTVGSIRAPAALCGVVGFKPTQRSVPRQGAIPLSITLDTIGPLARTVEDCALVYGVIAGEPHRDLPEIALRGLRLAIPQTRVLEDLDPEVSRAFERACSAISHANASLADAEYEYFAEIESRNACGVIEYVDALVWHKELLARRGHDYDPNVRARVEKGAQIPAIEYAGMLERRRELIETFDRATGPIDALILPTVSIVAPTIENCERDESNVRSKLLRNPSLFNFLDRPAITIPIQQQGDAPVGLMVVGERGQDWRLLGIARAVEALFRSSNRGYALV
jgi:aspartyl-tRNA(Asn)/glutamyl-tRNA(Gln) amidotransferase subunit A